MRDSRFQLQGIFLVGLLAFFPQARALAGRPPKSIETLYNEANLVVRGEIIDFKIGSVETDKGSDWSISIKIAVRQVVKGETPGTELVVTCFRPKMRNTSLEPSGCGSRIPSIPEAGIPLVVYLRRKGDKLEVLPPNGFQPLGEAKITNAKVVDKLEFEDWTLTTDREIEKVIIKLTAENAAKVTIENVLGELHEDGAVITGLTISKVVSRLTDDGDEDQ